MSKSPLERRLGAAFRLIESAHPSASWRTVGAERLRRHEGRGGPAGRRAQRRKRLAVLFDFVLGQRVEIGQDSAERRRQEAAVALVADVVLVAHLQLPFERGEDGGPGGGVFSSRRDCDRRCSARGRHTVRHDQRRNDRQTRGAGALVRELVLDHPGPLIPLILTTWKKDIKYEAIDDGNQTARIGGVPRPHLRAHRPLSRY